MQVVDNHTFTIHTEKKSSTKDIILIISANNNFFSHKRVTTIAYGTLVKVQDLELLLGLKDETKLSFIGNRSDLTKAQNDTGVDLGLERFSGIHFFKSDCLVIKKAIAVSNTPQSNKPEVNFGLFEISIMRGEKQERAIRALVNKSRAILSDPRA